MGMDNDVDDHEFSCYQNQQQIRPLRRNTLPPKFRRRSTIRDSVDLAYSIEEFVRNLKE